MAVAGLSWAGGMLVGPALFGAIAALWGPANAIVIAAGFVIALAALTQPVFSVLSPKPMPEVTKS